MLFCLCFLRTHRKGEKQSTSILPRLENERKRTYCATYVFWPITIQYPHKFSINGMNLKSSVSGLVVACLAAHFIGEYQSYFIMRYFCWEFYITFVKNNSTFSLPKINHWSIIDYDESMVGFRQTIALPNNIVYDLLEKICRMAIVSLLKQSVMNRQRKNIRWRLSLLSPGDVYMRPNRVTERQCSYFIL